MEDVLICGGGLGGLCAAAALAKKGIRSTVLEKAKTFGEIGAGIQIGPNGFRALDRLGVTPALRKSCVFIEDLRMMSAVSGQEITRIALGEDFVERFSFPYAVVHRAELNRILLDLCISSGLVGFRLSSSCVGYSQTDKDVTVHLGDGAMLTGKALIGADGLNSKIRRQVVGDGNPVVSGKSTYRTIIAGEDMPAGLRWNAGVLWAGPGVHAVHYPLAGGKNFNLVANFESGISVALRGTPISAADVQACFKGMAPSLQELIGRGQGWKHWVLCDRAPVDTWVDGRTALLGDAAHPMLQYFAQGACMAFEDAIVLANELAACAGDYEDGLRRYEDQRHARTARVQGQSRSAGAYLCHAGGKLAEYRDRNLARRTPERWHDVLNWIYGAELPRAAIPAKRVAGKPDLVAA